MPNYFLPPGPKSWFGSLRQSRDSSITVLTEDELYLLMDTCLEVWPGLYGKHFRAVVATAGFTAIRPAEKAAIRWSVLRLDELEADIVTQFDPKGRETEPKTEAGRRTIVVPAPAVKAIREGPALSDEFVFCAKQGKPFTKSGLTYYWHPLRQAFLDRLPADHHLRERVARCIKAGVDPTRAPEGKGHMHFYELRHFGLTRFLELGRWMNVMDVCLQVGHRNPQLLYDTYGHPNEAQARARLKELG